MSTCSVATQLPPRARSAPGFMRSCAAVFVWAASITSFPSAAHSLPLFATKHGIADPRRVIGGTAQEHWVHRNVTYESGSERPIEDGDAKRRSIELFGTSQGHDGVNDSRRLYWWKAITFGLTLPLSGQVPDGRNCGQLWCRGIQKSIAYLQHVLTLLEGQQMAVDSSTGEAVGLNFAIRAEDDKGSKAECLRLYREMALARNLDGQPAVAAFFGPAISAWNYDVAKLLNELNVPVILWSLDLSTEATEVGGFDSSVYGAWFAQFVLPNEDGGRRLDNLGFSSRKWSTLGDSVDVGARGPSSPGARLDDSDKLWRLTVTANQSMFSKRMQAKLRSVGATEDMMRQAMVAIAELEAQDKVVSMETRKDSTWPGDRRLQQFDGEDNFQGQWRSSWRTVFDVNLPDTTWALDALDRLRDGKSESWGSTERDSASPQTYLFVWFSDIREWSQNQRRCRSYRHYIQQTAEGVRAYAFGMELRSRIHVDSKVITALDPDVIVFCGPTKPMAYFVLYLKAAGYQPRAFVTDRPHGPRGVDTLVAEHANYFLEGHPAPVPISSNTCFIFNDLAYFIDGFMVYTARGGQNPISPDWPVIQFISAGLLLVNAVSSVTNVSLFSSGLQDWIPQHMRSTSTPTPLGDLTFSVDGRRTGARGSTRQILPYPMDEEQLQTQALYGDLWEIIEAQMNLVYQFYWSDIVLVSPDGLAACLEHAKKVENTDANFLSISITPSFCRRAYKYNVVYPMPAWFQKRMEIFRCAPGCRITNHRCRPCPVGYQRSREEMDCRPCDPGTFAVLPGTGQCQECPPGASCKDPTARPEALSGFFESQNVSTINISLVDTGDDFLQYFCATEFLKDNYQYWPCDPPNLCKGNSECRGDGNIGFLCGQCAEGYSSGGITPGMRQCTSCDSIFRPVLGVFLCVLVFGGLCYKMIRQVNECAEDPGLITLTVTRIFVHYYHIMGAGLQAVGLDALRPIAYLFLPSTILSRPLEVIGLDCLFSEGQSPEESMLQMFNASVAMVPFGLLCIVIFEVLILLGRYSAFILKYLMDAASRCCGRGRHRSSSPEADKAASNTNMPTPVSNDSAVSKGSKGEDPAKLQEHAREPKPEAVRNYIARLERLALLRRCRERLGPAILVWLLLSQGFVFQADVSLAACQSFSRGGQNEEDSPLLLLRNYDIDCRSETYKKMLGEAGWISMGELGFPIVLGILLVLIGPHMWDVNIRKITCVLFDGYRPPAFWWEIAMYFRTFLMYMALAGETDAERTTTQLFVLFFFLALHLYVWPFETRDRGVADKLELGCIAGVLIMVSAGTIVFIATSNSDPEVIAAQASRTDVSEVATNFFLLSGYMLTIFGMWFNAGLLFYGWLAMMYNTVSLPVQAIIESGSYVNYTSYVMHSVVRFFMGCNPVFYHAKGDEFTVDISNLYDSERHFLLHSLTTAISACIDSSNRFHTWLIENAIHEGFTRALNTRGEKLRHLYFHMGTRTHKMSMGCGFLTATMRPPDILPRPEEIPRNRVDILGKFHKLKQEVKLKVEDEASHVREPEKIPSVSSMNGRGRLEEGVTVEELHVALQGVNVDVLERHPRLHRRPKHRRDSSAQDEGGAEPLITWAARAPLDTLMDDLREHGTIEEDPDFRLDGETGSRRRPADGVEPLVMQQMRADTEHWKVDHDLVAEQHELEKQLEEVGSRIADLEHEFAQHETEPANAERQ